MTNRQAGSWQVVAWKRGEREGFGEIFIPAKSLRKVRQHNIWRRAKVKPLAA